MTMITSSLFWKDHSIAIFFLHEAWTRRPGSNQRLKLGLFTLQSSHHRLSVTLRIKPAVVPVALRTVH